MLALKCLAILLLLLAMTRGQCWIVPHYLAIHRPRTALAFLGLWAACVGGTWCAALIPNRAVRCAWAFLLGSAGLVTSAYVAICGVHLDWFGFETLLEGKFMAAEVVRSYGPTVIAPVLLGLGLFLAVALPPALPRWKNSWLAFAPILPILLVFQVFRGTSGNGIKGIPAPYNLLGLAPGFLLTSSPERSLSVSENLDGPPLARNIVLIVDESVRGDFIDLDRDRGVTPYLKSIRARVIDFGLASAAANISSSSNAILRMGANPASLVDGPDIRGNPTIWQYARRAGFKTAFIDCQSSNGTLMNFMNASERERIDDFIQLDGTREQRDFEAIPVVSRLLKEPGRHFIYMNKFGAHFPYQSGYPKAETLFSPHLEEWEPIGDRDRMINSYKNVIHWTVDTFFLRLHQQADLRDTLVIYTSDHGQNLLDDGIPVTHGRTHQPIAEEASVPLLIFAQNERLAAAARKAARINRDRASGFQIFPTLLSVMGFDHDEIRDSYHQTLFDPVKKPLGFISGGLFPVFGGRPRWNPFRFHDGTAGKPPRPRHAAHAS